MKLEVKESPSGSDSDITSSGGLLSGDKNMKKSEDKLAMESQENEKEEKGAKKDKPSESVSLIELFKFSDGLDIFLIVVGIINAILCGAIFSVMFIMFGDVTDVLTQYNPAAGPGSGNDAFLEGMNTFAKRISLVGFGIFIPHYIFVAAFNYTAERQVLRIRKEFLAAVLRQDIAWFDTNTTSDFATRMTEDLNKVQDGMGEKVGMMLRFIFAGLTAFIYPFIANWLLSLVLLSLVPILAVMGGVMGKARFQYKEKM